MVLLESVPLVRVDRIVAAFVSVMTPRLFVPVFAMTIAPLELTPVPAMEVKKLLRVVATLSESAPPEPTVSERMESAPRADPLVVAESVPAFTEMLPENVFAPASVNV